MADLTQEAERLRVFEEVESRFGTIDVLVNNAGLGWYGYGDEMSWKTAWEMLQVNVEAVVQLSLSFLAPMRQRNAGHIINVGSISGSLPSQGIALYGATKSFLDNFTTALYRELTRDARARQRGAGRAGADRIRRSRPGAGKTAGTSRPKRWVSPPRWWPAASGSCCCARGGWSTCRAGCSWSRGRNWPLAGSSTGLGRCC